MRLIDRMPAGIPAVGVAAWPTAIASRMSGPSCVPCLGRGRDMPHDDDGRERPPEEYRDRIVSAIGAIIVSSSWYPHSRRARREHGAELAINNGRRLFEQGRLV